MYTNYPPNRLELLVLDLAYNTSEYFRQKEEDMQQDKDGRRFRWVVAPQPVVILK